MQSMMFGTGMEEEGLEDMGFFSFSKSGAHADDAQQALNELGLVPSPPRPNVYEEEEMEEARGVHALTSDPAMPFDLDRELKMEELQRQEDCSQPTPYDLEEDEETLESNGVLDLDSSPVLTPTSSAATLRSLPTQPTRMAVNVSASHIRSAEPSTSRHTLAIMREAVNPHERYEEDAQIGINGIPKYIPAGVAHITLLDGTVAKFERRKRANAWRPKPVHYGAAATGLLSRPVHRIVEEVEAMNVLAVVRQNEAQAASVARLAAQPRTMSPEMWQERYRPARFTELIGEERSHREVMSWIKSWDTCVFGRRGAASRKRFREAEPDANVVDGPPMYRDKWDRPRERILLLGGSAGMGKTTLAHVAARTSGYIVHEINASDDRSAKTVEDRVRHALESNSLHGNASKQPTCLILDEVDGATGGGGADNAGTSFVRALIKLVENGGGGTLQGGAYVKRKGGKKQRPLLRPIICVCNDPYAPALRALRPYSKLVRLNRPSTPALIARLRQICEKEEIPHDSAGLNMLIALCQGDVRSCLNALQLVQNDPRGVTLAAIEGGGGDAIGAAHTSLASALSIKDGNASIHQTWMRLFRTHTSKERDRQRGARLRSKNMQRPGDEDNSASSELNELVASVTSSGEMDKVLAGCFEHYTNLKLVDDGWRRFSKAHDWIHWYEYLNTRGWEIGGHTDLWSYLPWSFACWHQLFANTANELPEYPRVDYQNHLLRTAFDEMAADVRTSLPIATRAQFDNAALVTELGPMLVPLLTPNLKPINAQLVRVEEKTTMTACVTLMHALNVDLVMDKNAQGHTFYRFDPPLEAFAHFEGKRVEGHTGPAARFNVRQMIAAELRSMRLRRVQQAAGEGKADRSAGKGKEAASGEAKTAVPKTKQALDFFGRPIVVKPKVSILPPALPDSIMASRQEKENGVSLQSEEAATEPCTKKAKLKVFYHFHEGYSNAVRKPIKMSALLS